MSNQFQAGESSEYLLLLLPISVVFVIEADIIRKQILLLEPSNLPNTQCHLEEKVENGERKEKENGAVDRKPASLPLEK